MHTTNTGSFAFPPFHPSSRSLVLTRRETFSLACFLELMETDIAVAESGSNVVSLAKTHNAAPLEQVIQ